jgi:hypothetical protein
MIDNLATCILGTITGESWQASGAVDDPDKGYPFTIAVHRDWLMTPRDDLGGKFPRQMLHGGHHWVEGVSIELIIQLGRHRDRNCPYAAQAGLLA